MWVSRLQLKSSLQYERAIEKKAIEKEFIRNGPVRLLEAVYCDPCKGKVMNNMMDVPKISTSGCLLLSYGKLVGTIWNCQAP